jgi:hypothetical protein
LPSSSSFRKSKCASYFGEASSPAGQCQHAPAPRSGSSASRWRPPWLPSSSGAEHRVANAATALGVAKGILRSPQGQVRGLTAHHPLQVRGPRLEGSRQEASSGPGPLQGQVHQRGAVAGELVCGLATGNSGGSGGAVIAVVAVASMCRSSRGAETPYSVRRRCCRLGIGR